MEADPELKNMDTCTAKTYLSLSLDPSRKGQRCFLTSFWQIFYGPPFFVYGRMLEK